MKSWENVNGESKWEKQREEYDDFIKHVVGIGKGPRGLSGFFH